VTYGSQSLLLKKVLLGLSFFILQNFPTQLYASNLWLEITTDIRGVDEILETYIDPNADQSENNNADNLILDASGNRIQKNNTRPTLRFGYGRQHMLSDTISISSSFVISNVYGRYDYPDGIILGGIDFSDPLSFKLSSWDFSLEQSINFVPHEDWSFGALFGVKRQFVRLDTFFGAWNLKDKFIANRIEGSVWIDRRVLSFDRTVFRLQGTKGKGNMRMNLSLRQYF
jgi:hypothetical protein